MRSHSVRERQPGCGELYRRWERQPWSATSIDLRFDALTWKSATATDRQYVFRLGRFAGLLQGEVSVADNLSAYVAAAPRLEHRLYLATQLADEARHVVFVHRIHQEVLGQGGCEIADSLATAERWVSPAMRRLTDEALSASAERLRVTPTDRAALADGLTLYHLLIESCLGLPALRGMRRALVELGGYPGLTRGLGWMLRDEVRHVLFGTSLLAELVADDAGLAEPVRECLTRWMPDVFDILGRMPADYRVPTAIANLRRKIALIGVAPPRVLCAA